MASAWRSWPHTLNAILPRHWLLDRERSPAPTGRDRADAAQARVQPRSSWLPTGRWFDEPGPGGMFDVLQAIVTGTHLPPVAVRPVRASRAPWSVKTTSSAHHQPSLFRGNAQGNAEGSTQLRLLGDDATGRGGDRSRCLRSLRSSPSGRRLKGPQARVGIKGRCRQGCSALREARLGILDYRDA